MIKKKFCVSYNYITSFDATVSAETKEEAIAKVKEVIGDDVEIEGAWEVTQQKACCADNGICNCNCKKESTND